VRVLLGVEREDLGIMPIAQAHTLAAELDLELVDDDAHGDPPVVRICDYAKMTYERRALPKEPTDNRFRRPQDEADP
jgi:translation initiation factor IF-3